MFHCYFYIIIKHILCYVRPMYGGGAHTVPIGGSENCQHKGVICLQAETSRALKIMYGTAVLAPMRVWVTGNHIPSIFFGYFNNEQTHLKLHTCIIKKKLKNLHQVSHTWYKKCHPALSLAENNGCLLNMSLLLSDIASCDTFCVTIAPYFYTYMASY